MKIELKGGERAGQFRGDQRRSDWKTVPQYESLGGRNMGNDATLPVQEPAQRQVVVVSQTGQGDYKSIAMAVNHATPGTTIQIGSGFYEESIVVSKPLTLIGDANGLVVIANSVFASLKVEHADLRVANIAFVVGLRLPSIEILSSNIDFDQCVFWALDTYLKDSNPSLLPARELVGGSALGASMRNAIPIRAMISDLLDLPDESPEGWSQTINYENPVGFMPQKYDSPDLVLAGRSEFTAGKSFFGMAKLMARERSAMSFDGCRFDCASATLWEQSRASILGSEAFGAQARPRVDIKDGGFITGCVRRQPARDLVKSQREATLLRRVQNWARQLRMERLGKTA